jgi:hypothetical protein
VRAKGKYCIRNWKEYHKSLIKRGSITIWFSEDGIEKWLAKKEKGKQGHPFIYSNDAILIVLMIRAVFHLPLRALQGFLASLVMLMRITLPVPCYTQICRRAKSLGQELNKFSKKNVTDLVIDSTGLKVYGEGEWKVRKHGYSKRRTWRKMHLAVCPDSNEIIFEILTENNVSDSDIYPKLLEVCPQTVERTYGAYDTEGCYQASAKHGCIPIIPPQKNAIFHKNAPQHMKRRNDSVLEILGLGGDEEARKLWKKLKGYHRRSLGETAMFRFKQLFGNNLRSRSIETQRAETKAKCEALNIMTKLGMPKGEWLIA